MTHDQVKIMNRRRAVIYSQSQSKCDSFGKQPEEVVTVVVRDATGTAG